VTNSADLEKRDCARWMNCLSCGVAIDGTSGGHPGRYCGGCVDEHGALKSREQVRARIARRLQSWQEGLDPFRALQRASRYMQAMPAWADDDGLGETAPPERT
jgi:hypothetical protein